MPILQVKHRKNTTGNSDFAIEQMEKIWYDKEENTEVGRQAVNQNGREAGCGCFELIRSAVTAGMSREI